MSPLFMGRLGQGYGLRRAAPIMKPRVICPLCVARLRVSRGKARHFYHRRETTVRFVDDAEFAAVRHDDVTRDGKT